uniref:Uncharacterized protein n=1 Tax=Paenibacillus polymyxa TaxID=1406 RepID=A0AAE9PQG2_PAEPO
MKKLAEDRQLEVEITLVEKSERLGESCKPFAKTIL